MKRKRVVRACGIAMIAAAIILALTGIYYDLEWTKEDVQAEKNSETLLEELDRQLEELHRNPVAEWEIEAEEEEEKRMEEVNNKTSQIPNENTESFFSQIPDETVLLPASGYECMGILSIPDLGMRLPVIYTEEWDPFLMDFGPVRYEGSVKDRNLIIMAHNWESHFRPILFISIGTKVYLAAFDGNTYVYEVTDTARYHRSQKEKLYEGEWDLTLFTCVPQTYNRMSVRCRLVQIIKGDLKGE